jgi:hypothetical protein
MKQKIYKCEKCEGVVNDSSKFCSHCGSMFDLMYKGEYTEKKPEKVKELEKALNIEFGLYEKTGSLYGRYKGKDIRLSNHPSKFKEKGGSLDLDYSILSVKDMIDAIKGIDPFLKLKEGDFIEHRRAGKLEFISYNKKEGSVEVKTKDGIKKYVVSIFTF